MSSSYSSLCVQMPALVCNHSVNNGAEILKYLQIFFVLISKLSNNKYWSNLDQFIINHAAMTVIWYHWQEKSLNRIEKNSNNTSPHMKNTIVCVIEMNETMILLHALNDVTETCYIVCKTTNGYKLVVLV